MTKFTLVGAFAETPDETWEENYDKDTDDPRGWAEETMASFNATLRPHEKARVLVDVINIIFEKELKFSSVNIGWKDRANLEIISYMDIGSIGAQHYYGNVWGKNEGENLEKVEVTKVLTSLEAKRLSKAWDCEYLEGVEHSSIETMEKVREAALVTWKESFPNAGILFEGHSASVEPKVILAYTPDVKQTKVDELNHHVGLYEETRGGVIDPSEELWDKLDQILMEWDNMLYDVFEGHIEFRTVEKES